MMNGESHTIEKLSHLPPGKLLDAHAKAVEALDRLMEHEVKPLKDLISAIEGALAIYMDKEGINSVKSDTRTAYFTTSVRYNVADRETYLQWLIDNAAWELITNHVAPDAIRAMETLPPGIAMNAYRRVTVRRI